MHVIPVPAPSPLSLLSTLAFLSTLLRLSPVFSYYCTSSLPISDNYSIFAAFPVFSLRAELLLLSFRPWPNSGGSDLRKGDEKAASGSIWEETSLIMSASSSCLPFLYQIQSDAGMSVVLLLFDYLSVSSSIRGRRGKSYYYLNPLSLKTSLGSKGGETLTGDWLNTTARDGLDNGCVTNTRIETHTHTRKRMTDKTVHTHWQRA